MTTAVFSPPGIVPSLTRAWVNLYCIGMTSEARAIRRLEIESDLWEHFADRAAEGVSSALTSVETFSRLLRGVPSDIAWRVQAEGFHMNINIPIERLAGVLLLFLIIPFVAGTAISGYDTGRSGWPDEFQRFAEMSSSGRAATAGLHALIGVLTIAASAILLTSLGERSRRLVALASSLLLVAGVIMLINATVYRSMSHLADEYLATGNASLLPTARSLALTVEGLSMVNGTLTTSGLLALGIALVRLGTVPKWTVVLPALGAIGPLLWVGLGSAFPDSAWWTIAVTFTLVALWLLICGFWLLFGGSNRLPSMKGVPAHVG